MLVQRSKRKTRDGIFAYGTERGQRWGVDYRDPVTRHERRKVGFPTRQAALRWKAEKDEERLGLKPKESDSICFDVALARYLQFRIAQGHTMDSYYHLSVQSKAGNRPGFWAQAFGRAPLNSITSERIEALLEEGAKRRGWSAATRNRALAQLSGLFSYAYGRRWIDSHPIERGRVPRLAERNACARWLRIEEVAAITAASPPWLAVIIKFAVSTGMRLGEITSLTCGSYQQGEGGRDFLVTEPTKNKERHVWPLEGWPREYVLQRLQEAKFPGDYLFPAPRNGNAYIAVQRELPAVIRKAGLVYGRNKENGITFHTCRHSFASLALNNGIPESIVQRMGNWKTATMVMRYAHLADESFRQAAGKIADLVEHPRHADAKTTAKGVRATAEAVELP
jgi:integrase